MAETDPGLPAVWVNPKTPIRSRRRAGRRGSRGRSWPNCRGARARSSASPWRSTRAIPVRRLPGVGRRRRRPTGRSRARASRCGSASWVTWPRHWAGPRHWCGARAGHGSRGRPEALGRGYTTCIPRTAAATGGRASSDARPDRAGGRVRRVRGLTRESRRSRKKPSANFAEGFPSSGHDRQHRHWITQRNAPPSRGCRPGGAAGLFVCSGDSAFNPARVDEDAGDPAVS